MPISAERFLARVASRGLLSKPVLIALRKQLAESQGQITAQALAQLLLENGHLTAFQAEEMLRDRRDEQEGNAPQFPAPGPIRIAELESPPPPSTLPVTPAPTSAAGAAEPPEPPASDTQPAPTGAAPAGEAGGVTADSLPAPSGVESIEDLLSASDAADASFARDLGGRGSLWPSFGRKKAAPLPDQAAPRSEWESPLLLVGGGALILLILLGGTVYYLIERGGGDKLREAADAAYDSGSYAQAIDKYDQFLERFPHHASASQGRVRRGLARLRLVLQTSHDGPQRLATAREVLEEIEEEPAFPEARAELAALLPRIAEGLAKQAASSQQAEQAERYIDLTTDALALVTNSNYVPRSLYPQDRVANIRATLDEVRRKLNRERRLQETLAQIQQAVAAGDTNQAYARRAALLDTYPTLETDPALARAVAAIVQAERTSVRRIDQVRSAAHEASQLPSVAVAQPRSTSTARAPGEPVLMQIHGAVYALDGGTGNLLWRQAVGLAPRVLPQPIAGTDDVLLVRRAEGALLRVDRGSGTLRWRLPLGERLLTPRVDHDKVFAAARSGKIFSIDARSGTSAYFVQLPQPVATPPALNPTQPVLYQVAEHSTLFVLSRDDLSCPEAVTIGHRAGSVVVPPAVVLGRYVAIAENRGQETSVLHLLVTDKQGRNLRRVGEARLEGHVVTGLKVAGRLLVAATDRGQIKLFELGAPGEEEPLVQIAERSTIDKTPLARYVLIDGANLWLAGTELIKFRVQTQNEQLVPAGVQVSYPGQVFAAPLQRAGDQVIHVRRPRDREGYIVTAMGGDDGQVRWETVLGQAPAGPPVVSTEPDRIALAVSDGAVFEMDAASFGQRRAHNEPLAAVDAPDTPAQLSHRIDLPDGRVQFVPSRGAGSILLYDPKGDTPAERLHWSQAPRAAACLPAALGRGILWPTRDGQVLYLAPGSDQPIARPFQPELRPGALPRWLTPTAVPGSQEQFVIADAEGVLFLVGFTAQPQPHFRALASTPETTRRTARPPAIAGRRIYTVMADRHLATYRLPELAPGPEIDLPAAVTWGPYAAGSGIVLATETGEAILVDGNGAVAWRTSLTDGPLVGRPLVDEHHIVAASRNGAVLRIALETGKIAGRREAGQPLATGPVPLGSNLVLAAPDGTLLRMPPP